MSKPTKTRAIRLSDETWNELKRRANEYSLRGRAEYLEMLCKEDEDKPEDYIKWDGEKGWWAGNKLDQYRPGDAAPIKPTLDSVVDMALYGNAYFAADTGLPIKARSFSFEIPADTSPQPTLVDEYVRDRIEAEALELENKIAQSGVKLSELILVFIADAYGVEKSLQEIAEYVERGA